MIFQNNTERFGITHELEVKKLSGDAYFIYMANLFKNPSENTNAFMLLNKEEITQLINELTRLQKL